MNRIRILREVGRSGFLHLSHVHRAAAAVRPRNPELAAAVVVRSSAGLTRTKFRREPGWRRRPEVEAELTDLALRYFGEGRGRGAL